MEDYSRELEKEIKAHTRPVQKKRRVKSSLFFMDDFGRIKSAFWIKGAAWFLFAASIALVLTSGFFYYLYRELHTENKRLAKALAAAEKKTDILKREKELIMARLVLDGKDISDYLNIHSPVEQNNTDASGRTPGSHDSEELSGDPAKKEPAADKSGVEGKKPEKKQAQAESDSEKDIKPKSAASGEKSQADKNRIYEHKYDKVKVEAFKIEKDPAEGDLLVRFDIRNVSDNPGTISGRIFVVLKPDLKDESQWLVMPSVPLGNGEPSVPRRGQYFSIAHFKPVKFRVKSHQSYDLFTSAEIYVFNDSNEIMFTRNISYLGNRHQE
ncbi:MAG: hypothetical protein U9P10_09115 [Thermodesulfobacteriota bacterium]|nr:hypothetical protein [Thermodesulfobacteriota bacterium]